MKNGKKLVILVAVLITAAIILSVMFAEPVLAQVRAALVRDMDAPALAPFTASVDYTLCCFNDQRLLTTVPAGKRLVIEHISYWSAGDNGPDQLVFSGLRRGQYGPFYLILQINPAHPAADPAFTIQDGSQMVKAYFEAGDQVWVSVSHNTAGFREMELHASGYYVTP